MVRLGIPLMGVLVLSFCAAWAAPPPACEWSPGMYWEWSVTPPQSPSSSVTTRVYVLKAERWGDYEVDFLAWIWPFELGESVQLGAAVRQPCGQMRGFGLWAPNAHRWWIYPPGTEIEQRWQGGVTGEGTLRVTIADEEVTVEVPAGVFEGCVHLTLAGEYMDGGEGHEVREEVWFSRELGWPVKGIFRYGLLPESHFELLGLGQLELREAVARVLAAVDSMAALGDPFEHQAFRVREQLRSLGLPPEE